MKGLELDLSASDHLSLSGIQIGGEASITQTFGCFHNWTSRELAKTTLLKQLIFESSQFFIPQGLILETIAIYEDNHFDCSGES